MTVDGSIFKKYAIFEVMQKDGIHLDRFDCNNNSQYEAGYFSTPRIIHYVNDEAG